jgi:organic hydroperoxide reductase OsmC/OhrA
MNDHRALISWQNDGSDFLAKNYNRDHRVTFPPEQSINASAAAAYGGNATAVDPEQMLAAAVASCHMLTFLAVAAVKGFVVQSYVDEAVAHLEKNAEGRMAVSEVILHPKIVFQGEVPNAEVLSAMHDKSHRACFIANSVRAKITIVVA